MSSPAAASILLTGLILGTLGSLARAEEGLDSSVEGTWIQLFNGRDLDGWTAKIAGYPAGDNYADTFRVEDGVIRVAYDRYNGPFNDRFGHLFYKESFSHYVLRVEYRFVGEQVPGGQEWALRNSGVMFHGQSPQSMARDQRFPVSLEFQMLGGNGHDRRPTGNLCTPGTIVDVAGKPITSHCVNSSSETYHGDGWVTAEIEVHAGRLIRHKVNGATVLEYSNPRLDEHDQDAKRLIENGADKTLTGGTISLQSESHPIEFRNIEIMPLEE
jgi:hypothetical protein